MWTIKERIEKRCKLGKWNWYPLLYTNCHWGLRNLLSISAIPTPKLYCSTAVFRTAPFFWVHLCKCISNLMLSYEEVSWRRDIFVLENWQLGQGHPKKGNSALSVYYRMLWHIVSGVLHHVPDENIKMPHPRRHPIPLPREKNLPLTLVNYFCIVYSWFSIQFLHYIFFRLEPMAIRVIKL